MRTDDHVPVLEIDAEGDQLIAELEKAVDQGELDIARHAEARARRIGTSNLVKNVIVPLVKIVREKKTTKNSDR